MIVVLPIIIALILPLTEGSRYYEEPPPPPKPKPATKGPRLDVTRYLFGPHPVQVEEARKFCKTYWGRLAQDYHPREAEIVGLPGQEFWYDGGTKYGFMPAMGSPYTFGVKRGCGVMNGYGVFARVPCDHLALPFCEVTVDWAGFSGNLEYYKDNFKSWNPKYLGKKSVNKTLEHFSEEEPTIATEIPKTTEVPDNGPPTERTEEEVEGVDYEAYFEDEW
ncbi:hypothetical protein FGIG_09983 [Fasciola gigantica]|uniref:C-type lectin domain-containing protein n=1 Tax=Fasciola gigantica TaxID=46835 RepID=A0A504YB14_FASGI|nr:hypothetical protein FGIG_09983 [Fasciola gigantica]